jgi:hypothetical protein
VEPQRQHVGQRPVRGVDQAPQGEVGQLPQPSDRHRCVGQRELHGLEGGDRLAELDPPGHVLDRQLDRAVGGPEHGAGGEGQVEHHVGAGVAGERVALVQVGDERPEAGAERAAARRGPRRSAEAGHPPLAEQVAVVDPGRGVRHDGERPAVAVGQQHARHGVREGAAARGLAQRGGRGECVGTVPGVEVAGAERGERARHVRAAHAGVVLRPAGGVGAADVGEGPGGGGAELEGLVGQDRVHRALPSSERATIIRWTSIVPEATVAAWA